MKESPAGHDLCKDVVLCILLRLPAVSLGRFKLVCKSWCSIIETPDFIHQHALRPRISDDDDDDDEKLLVFNFFITDSDNFRLYSGKYFQSLSIIRLESIGFSTSTLVRNFCKLPQSIISSFNGIILLQSINDTHIYIWNPLTRQVKPLPSPSLNPNYCERECNLLRLGSCFSHVGSFDFGFGFDSKTKDYKVVLMLIHCSSEDLVKSGIEIYSLRTNSWRIIDAVLPIHFIVSTPKSLLFNGRICCWLGEYIVGETLNFLILSFDFATEMFDTVPVPDHCSYLPIPLQKSLDMELLRGKIALFERNFSNVEYNCKVWVLQEYGVKESWTNLYTLRLESLAYLYGFSDNGKIIFGNKDPVSLSLYDPATHQVMVISSKEIIQYNTQVATYKESLVSITRATDTFEESSSEESSGEDDEYSPRA